MNRPSHNKADPWMTGSREFEFSSLNAKPELSPGVNVIRFSFKFFLAATIFLLTISFALIKLLFGAMGAVGSAAAEEATKSHSSNLWTNDLDESSQAYVNQKALDDPTNPSSPYYIGKSGK